MSMQMSQPPMNSPSMYNCIPAPNAPTTPVNMATTSRPCKGRTRIQLEELRSSRIILRQSTRIHTGNVHTWAYSPNVVTEILCSRLDMAPAES